MILCLTTSADRLEGDRKQSNLCMAFSWKENCTTINQRWVIFKQLMREQDTRDKTESNKVSQLQLGVGEPNYGIFMIISQTGS